MGRLLSIRPILAPLARNTLYNYLLNSGWSSPAPARLFYACDAISFTTMAAGPVSIHFVCGETRRPAGNCFATPVLVGRDATAAIVVNEMRETAVPGISYHLHAQFPILFKKLAFKHCGYSGKSKVTLSSF